MGIREYPAGLIGRMRKSRNRRAQLCSLLDMYAYWLGRCLSACLRGLRRVLQRTRRLSMLMAIGGLLHGCGTSEWLPLVGGPQACPVPRPSPASSATMPWKLPIIAMTVRRSSGSPPVLALRVYEVDAPNRTSTRAQTGTSTASPVDCEKRGVGSSCWSRRTTRTPVWTGDAPKRPIGPGRGGPGATVGNEFPRTG